MLDAGEQEGELSILLSGLSPATGPLLPYTQPPTSNTFPRVIAREHFFILSALVFLSGLAWAGTVYQAGSMGLGMFTCSMTMEIGRAHV